MCITVLINHKFVSTIYRPSLDWPLTNVSVFSMLLSSCYVVFFTLNWWHKTLFKVWKKYLNCESVCFTTGNTKMIFWNPLAFPDNHKILLRGLKSVKSSDCWEFSQFKDCAQLPGSKWVTLLFCRKVEYLQSTVSKNRFPHCRRYTSCWKYEKLNQLIHFSSRMLMLHKLDFCSL